MPKSDVLHRRVSECARRFGEAVAVRSVGDGTAMSYSELDQSANDIALRLITAGMRSEELVGVAVPRSVSFVPAALGILKAGGAYVPLGLSAPRERIRWMIEDAKLRFVVTLPTDGSPLELARGLETVEVRADAPDGGRSVERAVPSGSAAYVLYTSGSTGRPKGVVISHAAVLHYLDWAIQTYDIRGAGPVLLHSPVTFDLTVTCLWGPLVSGGYVEIVDEGNELETLRSELEAGKKYRAVKLTPAHLEVLAKALPPKTMREGVETLIVGGDALFTDAVENWRRLLPNCRVFNEYGPTEATVGCCFHEVTGDAPPGPVPIGGPPTGAKLVIAREVGGDPVREGIGELFIGGPQLARGYLNQAGLTAERFVPDWTDGGVGERLYRTGDLVRKAPGSEALEFVGRSDRQVSVRGHRVELEEIENVLRNHPGVSQCVAMITPHGNAGRLYALVVLNAGVTAEGLGKWVSTMLEGYMLPTIVVTASLPLTANGKIDTIEAIAAVEAMNVSDKKPLPVADGELAALWEQVLGRGPRSRSENFFEAGGHSLLAIRLLNLVEESAGIAPDVLSFFAEPTLDALRRLIDGETVRSA